MIQLQFLNYLLDTRDSSLLIINNLGEEFFSDYKYEYRYIKNHLDQYGVIPDKATFLAKFPSFDLIEVNETSSYLIDALYEDKNKRFLANSFNKVRDLLNKGKTEEAMRVYLADSDKALRAKHIEPVDLLEDTSRYDDYVERCQDFSKYYISTGFKELDDIIGGWDREEELATIAARPGIGKCLAKGTMVRMADGTCKPVENIVVGDKVQSMHKVNTVLALHSGISSGYKIIPSVGGTPFTVSKNHILTIFERAIGETTYTIKDILIEDYLRLSEANNGKYEYKLYRAPIQYSEKEYSVNPYDFGKNLSLTSEIPLEYLTGSMIQRIDLFQGIISNRIEHLASGESVLHIDNEVLASQILQLARGIGYTAWKDNALIHFNFALETYTTFKVEPIEEVEYFGFMCDGDSRYLLEDNTVTHNTWIALKCSTAALSQGLRVGIYSGEMSARKVGYRIDTLLSHISNTCISKGNSNVQVQYKTFLEELPKKYKGCLKVLTPDAINGPAGVNALKAFIDKEKLDILFVDQHSLLEDDRRGRNEVERASNISKDLKNLQVMRHIPIIAVSQQNRTSTETGVDTSHIARSDRIAQDSTIVIFVEQKDGIMTLNLTKSRDSENRNKISYRIDLDKGEFIYIPDTEDMKACEELRDEFETDVF